MKDDSITEINKNHLFIYNVDNKTIKEEKMANQYFENNENLQSEIKKISYFYKGVEINFFADNGVFSKSGIDFGSNLLLKTVDLRNTKTVLDVGCGYGTIGVTIAKTFAYLLNKEVKLQDLIKLGISSDKGTDLFLNRIMFPLFDLEGNVVAFSGRIFVLMV